MDCVICKKIEKSDAETYLYQSEHWLLRHSSETNIEGYLILEARRHILDFSQASTDELAAYGPLLATAMKAIRKVVSPERVYTFSLAEAVPHLHVHLIPRSAEMPRAWKGRGILAYPLEPTVNPARLTAVCQSLRQELKRQILIG